MKFRPCIDLHGGVVKQIVGSTLKDNDGSAPIENFVAEQSSAEFAELYAKHQMLGGHIIMLGKGNEEAALGALHAFPGGMQVGGGINPSNAQKYIDAGASHVIVTSYVFRDGAIDYARLNEMVNAVGKSNLVLDLSCRRKDGAGDYYVVTDRWQKYTDFVLSEQSLAELATYCDEFLVHGVDVEGMRVGIIEELVTLLGVWSPIPVT
jgi:phosphoribosylformimino-5-aminoimidazole carboxamide ribotide isomerase